MVILAVDYGDVRTGLAICDKSEMLAVPLSVITQKDADALAISIKKVAEEKGAEKIVIGLPKNMDASLGFRAEATINFAEKLKNIVAIPIKFWDERLTTVSAHTLLNQTKNKGQKRKKIIDAVAATMILQDYLDFRKNEIEN